MHILIAPNAFKNSLSARDAAEAIRQGLLQSGLNCSTQCFPIGDGGEDILHTAENLQFTAKQIGKLISRNDSFYLNALKIN